MDAVNIWTTESNWHIWKCSTIPAWLYNQAKGLSGSSYLFSSVQLSSQTVGQQLWGGQPGWYQSKELAAAQIPSCTCRWGWHNDEWINVIRCRSGCLSIACGNNEIYSWKSHTKFIWGGLFSPLYSVVPVFGIFAVRVQEDVLVYPSTEAEHVWRWMFTRLQHLQHHSESLLPVTGTVPPEHVQIYKWLWDYILVIYSP